VLLDRSFRAAFNNFSTLFLVVLTVTLPLHIVYGYVYRDVIALGELHPRIEQLREDEQLRGVGGERLEESRRVYVGLTALEIAMLPLLAKAAERTIELDEAGRVPTATRAWRGVLSRRPNPLRRITTAAVPSLLAALAVAIAVGVLAERIGSFLAEPLDPESAVAALALVQALARAIGAPFFLAAAATSASDAKGHTPFAPTL
jgi:hypothetical protein